MKKRNKVKGFESRLAEAVLLLKKNRLLLFSGPLFSGRSSLAKAIAKCSEPSLNPVFVSFDDQIDSKTLFGSYQSSGIPGDFSWEASSFMDALASESTLIVIKSWETANADTQNAVIQLATDGVVILPGNRRVEINPTSRMIGITSDYGVNRNIPFPLTLNFHPLSKSEMLSRLSSCRVSGVKLDELYELFIKIRRHIETLPHSERRLMTRDFFVLCNRLDGESASVTDIFLDLVDVFVSHLSKRSYQEAPLQEIASFLSIASNSVEFIEKERDVTISVTKDLLTVGRKSLKVERRCLTASSLLPFAPTRSYRVLMEKIAACVANKESVLLNGETGIGKTRLVQELAHRLNIPLDTINLSLDSEAADIVGGFKPVNIGVLVKQLLGSLFLFFGGNPKLKEMLMHLLVTKKYCTLLNSVSRIVQISMQNSTGDSFVILSRLLTKVEQLLNFASNGTCNTPFTFVVGILIKAMNEGHWLLLDEINMGTSECLNGLSSIISEQLPSAHPNFRLFACMNPATDSGKKMLSQNVRALFTEFFVHPPRDFSEISEIIRQYIVTSKTSDLANFYLNMSSSNPRRFSLRNLCRSLLLIKDDVFRNVEKSTRMALTLGFNDGNATNLSLIQVPFKPLSDELRNKFILVEGVFFPRGPNNIQEDPDYIRTASVQTNVQAIAAAAASGRFPVLLEGETSTGKTTVITHLAKVAGYTVYRINNHEQTDIQEYVGSYVPNKDNKLEFQEGVLLKAVRNGDWVILDELNLAPTEVLEALNRLLDDNRELVVPERDICVKAHPNFRLFATQNPAGLYGGRKKLSRAFLNRFVVIKFDQPPKEELVKIVSIRCEVSESAAKLMIQVMLEMKVRRSNTRLFNSTGLMTLRDLFRWGNRVRLSEDGTDWRQELCNQGFFLLASKNRTEEDSFRVKSILEGVLKRTIDVDKLYSVESPYFPQNLRENCSLRDGFMVLNGSMVLTSSLIRMIVLFNEAAKVNEPILLVGETGCGKTAVTYLMSSGSLEFINCHERTDVSDLLGSIRPASDGLFHWQDGVVIRAMKNGSVLLIDEISLANDSVLERLNSMLEPSRMILLADSGASSELVTAVDGFKCVATMNPGGDYGKKELSKALRNRFTEIWCSFDADEKDVLAIIKARFDQSGSLPEEVAKLCGKFLSKYLVEFYSKFGKYLRHKLCVRDVVVVAEMLSNFVKTAAIEPAEALYHTISSHVLDSLPIICNGYHIRMVDELTHLGKELFLSIYEGMTATRLEISTLETMSILEDSGNFKVGPFSVPKGPFPPSSLNEFNINAKSTALNALRVARGFAAGKPIMLEGMPGSGKSSLIGALAQVSGNHLIRLNLSDQTEVTDLFGSDVPITLPDGTVSFTWKDGPILKALKEGSWVLLDEMNLAPQAILEALNSCFDFRKTLYISELGRSFVVDSEKPALFFACQNPERMGGNRHSLPKSFLNRFVTIFTKDMDDEDFKSIVNFVVKKAGLKQDAEVFIRIHSFCNERISVRKGSGVPGAPLEYNLRDLMRFIDCSKKCDILSSLDLVYLARLWNVRDRINYRNEISQSVLNLKTTPCPVVLALKDENLKILEWDFKADFSTDFKPLSCQLKILQNLVICVEGGLLALLVGPASCGKEKLVTFTSQLFRTRLNVIKLNSETDAQDLLGSYEHIVDADAVKECVERVVHLSNTKKLPDHVNYLIEALKTVKSNSESRTLINLLVKETEGSDIGQTLLQISHEISRATLSFDWIDSDFVRAYSEGHWVLIKDVNCCSAAVLDRLNNCLERDGELVLSEKVDGEFRVLKRHPNFRVFLTMRPENGNISSAMRNRTAEIRFDRQECWVSSWVDTLRLLPTNMGHLVTQLQSLEGGISGLHSDMAGFMKTMNLPLSSRLSMFGLTSEDDDCPNSLITDAVSSFYHVSWFLETFAFDRGLSLTYSHVLLSSDPQQIFPADFWEESFLMDPISDLTVFGAMDASIDTGRKQYVISHLVSFILSENLKPNHPSSLVLTSVDLEPKTIPSVLIEVYRPFLDYLQTHTETLNVKFLFFGYVFIKFIKSEWNRDIGDVIGLEIIQILHQFNHSEKVESAFLKSLNDVLVMVKVDVDKPPCNSLPDVMPFTTSAQVNAAKARLDSVMVRLDVPDKIMDVLKFQMKILIESLKSVLILNFEHGFLDTYTRMLSYFPIQDRQLLLKMQLIALLRTRVNLGGTNFFISDVIQSDALNPLINLFWKRLGFRTNVNELKVLELVNFDGLLKELIDDVSIFTCLIYQVKAKVTDFVNEFYPEEDTPSELERVKKMMPVDLIDPVLKQYASKEINNQLKQVLDTLSQILRTYGRNVFGSTEDFEMCFTSLSERSSRLSCDLHCLAQENKKALVELEKLGERVRPPNTKFFQLCRLIEMFMGQMEKFFELGEDKIKLAVFHNAVNRHVDQLTSSFWEYPDIITPYVSAIFELELSLLLKYSSVDDSTMTSLLDGFDWIESTNVNARIEWLSREISSFPLRLQTQMIREALFIERIRPGSTIFMALDWLKVQWQRWYQSVQKKKAALFEYKTTQMKKRETEGKLGEDGTQYVDEEMIEIEQMLPDFSAKAEVKFTEQMNELNVLSEDEMLGLIKSVLQLEYPLDEINLYGPMLNKSDRSLITLKSANLDVHLAALLQLKSNVAEKRTDILNVYKYNSPPLLIDCVTKLQKLIDRVNTLIKSFPESNILKNIIVAVNSFFDTSSCHPQMMYTSLLEAVLEKAEFWEANTCREYSLSDLLLPLKEVILDWRKMEVVCWSDIIRQAQTTSHNNAVLSSWPMFEAFTNFEDVSEDYEKKLLVMLIQWLNDSSLNDFIARIETGEMAVAWMERAGKRNNILSKLRSIIYYHRQFVDATKERARPALDEAEEKLQNLVKVAKYTDLNLWSVKDSSQRVHNQICRLIHAYKVELNKPANSIFLDSILPIPKSLSTWISNMEWDLLKGRSSGPFTDFIENLQRILSRSYACEEGHQLIDTAKALFEQIQHDVDYSVAKNTCNSDDKEEIEKVKQKMFSKEMLKRRRTFADLRKKTINFGFNYRKGLTIETDRLTEVTMTSFDQTSDETLNASFLLCSSARNVIVKLLAEFNHHQHHHVASQLPVENFNFVKGVVEFGEEGLLSLNRSVCDIEKLQKELTLTIHSLESLEMIEGGGFDYEEIMAAFDELSASFVIFKRKFATFSQRLTTKDINIPDHFTQFVPRFLKNGEDYDKLQEVMLEVSSILNEIRFDKESLQRFHVSHLVKHFTLMYAKFYSVVNLLNTVKELCGDCGHQLFKSLVKFWSRLEKLLKIVKQNQPGPMELTFDIGNLMLKSQSIYRYFEKAMDKPYFTKLASFPEYLEGIGIKDQIAAISKIRNQLNNGCLPRDKTGLLNHLRGFSDVVNRVLDYSKKGSILSSTFFYEFCISAERILKKGFLNPIPNQEKDAGEGAGEISGEPSGMGEGTGQTDVGKDIEETGQVEGLQDDPATDENDTSEPNKDEAESPLDMDQEFAADLEDLDDEEGGGDDDKDDNGGEDDKEPDWDMGDVMEEEEKQIDPRLWDQEKKNPDNMDDEEQGAQEETGETVAQAEEASGKGLEQDETVEEDNENREENHDETEMENVDAVDLDDDEDPQNEGDEENMELDSTGNEEEAQKDEMDITETEDIDETEEAESKGKDDQKEKDDKTNKDGEQAQSIETDGKGTGQAEKNVQETNESLENQGEEEGLNEEEGESGVEGYEKQKKENAGPNDAIKDSQDVEISKVHEDEEAEQVHQSQVVQGEENDAIDETQKTFAEKSDVDLSSAAHYVQKSTTVEKSKEMASEKINNEIREENQNMGERTKEFNAQLEQRHILDTFYLNTTVDVGTVIRAQDAIDSLKEFMACLDGGDEKHQLEKKWQFISQSVTTDAFELAEALRILIEPTKASKFQGDYRSGKRLNMRRLIPYIASNYQKNKIWMRRTKPAKRTVHVCLAIDDSYSMRENMMTEITCQTVCLLEKSFKQLEIGQVSICKFGMDVEMLCGSAELSDMDVVGPSLLKNLQFSQTKTDLQALLVKMGEFFGSSRQVSEASHQLLIIIGDGRGAMVNGAEPIKNQVQHLVNNGVTTLYLIVDNPTSSVFSMKVANRVSEKMQLSNYMDLFPFSFYSVVQNAAVIPLAVSEALKQWMDALML